jgi:hypothetical protein
MTRLLFVLGLLVLTTPADAVPTWRLLSGLWAPFYWSYAGIESEGQGRIYHTWNGQTWLFNPVTNVWVEQPLNLPSHGPSWSENFGIDYDPTNNLFWNGNCLPCGAVDGVAIVGSLIFTYDPATGLYVNRTALEPGTIHGCGGNAVMAWQNNALYCWGGINGVYGTELRRKFTSPDLNSPWVVLATANAPLLYIDQYEGSSYTSWRGGVNRTQNYLWMIAARNELWKCPLVANDCAAWVQVPTTGIKPTARWVSYALDESRNKIVGWVGQDCNTGAENCTVQINQTYMLDLTTNVWSLGPGPSDPHPVTVPQSAYIPLYDRVRNRVLWAVSARIPQEGLWWYDDDGTGPPAGTPPTAPSKPDRHPQ